MSRWLVTGGTGFIGSRFTQLLERRGNTVFRLSRRRLAGAVQGDIFDDRRMIEVLRQVAPTHLALLAWTTEHGKFWNDPSNELWRVASLRLAQRFLELGGRVILGAGSCAEYAWNGDRLAEASSPIAPQTRYGAAKAELALDLARACTRFQACSIWGRVFFVYGPGEKSDKLVSTLVHDAKQGKPAQLRDPDRRLDFVFVDDVAGAFDVLAKSESSRVYNVGSGVGTSVRELAAIAGAKVAHADTINMSSREADVIADIGRISALGWTPSVPVSVGIARLRATL